MSPQEEHVEVITWLCERTGVIKPKSQAHNDGDIHICVHVIITDGEGRVLEHDRGPECTQMRDMPDIVSCGGHTSAPDGWDAPNFVPPDLIQLIIETAIREPYEELGVRIEKEWFFTDKLRLIGVTRTDYITEDGWPDRSLIFNFMLVIPGFTGEGLRFEPGKVVGARMVHVDHLERILSGETPNPYHPRPPDGRRMLAMIIDNARRKAQGL